MSAKHTPGPWEWDRGVIPPDGPGRYCDVYVDAGETIIASVNDLIPEGVANLHLIAAAPDLLAALEEILDIADGHSDGAPDATPSEKAHGRIAGIAALVIAKAEGGAK